MNFRIFRRLLSLSLIAFFIFSCKKPTALKEIDTESTPKQNMAVASTTTPAPDLLAWEEASLQFYDFSDYAISPTATDNDLQMLGDLIGRSSFDSASTMFNISVSTLQTMRNSYYNAYSENYYANTLQAPASTGGVQTDFMSLPRCEEQFGICKDDARVNYLEGMGACFVAGLASGAVLTPIGGMIGGIGCGLLQGRRYSNAKRSCQITYDNCQD
jgi:hypothetical protein